MTPGPLQIALIILVILILFGRGRISEFMGDFGKGIKSFKSGLNDDEGKSSTPSPRINGPEETVSGEQAKQPDGSDKLR